MNISDKLRMHELILKSLEEDIGSSEFSELNHYLSIGPDYRSYYLHTIDLYAGLYEGSEIIAASAESIDPILQEQLWDRLAEYEKMAPAQPMETVALPETTKPDKTFSRQTRYTFHRTSLYPAVAAAAVFLLLIVYITFIPARRIVEPVATLTDAVGTRWANTTAAMEIGTIVSSDQGSMILTEGAAEFVCRDQTRVVLEAPASFEFLSVNRIALNYGQLYAVSSAGVAGFTVDTPGTHIVDLGTEFGIKVEVTGVTEVHMIKGKARLVIDDSQHEQNDVILTEQQARRVDVEKSVFRIMPFHSHDFIREIDSQQKTVWRGQDINLADIVGGGNGFGSGLFGMAIDPRTGKKIRIADMSEWLPYEDPAPFRPVAWHDFIDGVFVPDGEAGPVTVTSSGLNFKSCPDTDNRFWTGIANGGRFPEPIDTPPKPLRFNQAVYGTAEHPGIFMHSNLGITFDLDAIRRAYPDINLTEFRAVCGICDNGPNRLPYADFWVLIDGRLEFSRIGVRAGIAHKVRVPIADQSRFLTLITTDGGTDVCYRLEDGYPVPIDSDWCIFADPFLVAERK